MDATTTAFINQTMVTTGDFFSGLFPLVWWFVMGTMGIFFFAFIYNSMKALPRGASRIIRGKRF